MFCFRLFLIKYYILWYTTEQGDLEAMPWTCIRWKIGSNPCQDSRCPNRGFRCFPKSLQANIEIVPWLGQDRFLPNPFQLIIFLPLLHSMLYSLVTGNVFKQEVLGIIFAYFPSYDTGHIENEAPNNYSIVACVFVAAVTFLPRRCLQR
jgi:hypothetical protein